jgi:hypothetical protein
VGVVLGKSHSVFQINNAVCSVSYCWFCLFYHAFNKNRIFLLIEPSDALIHHLESKFHEVLQSKQECFADSSGAKILEMIKSNNLDVSCYYYYYYYYLYYQKFAFSVLQL